MNNNKGFTLVELIAVIAILAILAAIATPIVLTVQKNIKQNMYESQVKMIRENAIMCVEKQGDSNCNTISKLCLNNYMKIDEKASKQTCTASDCPCQSNAKTGDDMGECGISFNKTGKRWTVIFTGKVNGTTKSFCPQATE